MRILLSFCFLGILLAFSTQTFAGDAAKGKKVFNKCKACHLVSSGKHKTGPSLLNVFGRTAGTAEGYKRYSKALKNSEIVWNEETIAAFLKEPRKYIPKNKMGFRGLKKDADIENVISYIKENSQ